MKTYKVTAYIKIPVYTEVEATCKKDAKTIALEREVDLQSHNGLHDNNAGECWVNDWETDGGEVSAGDIEDIEDIE